MYLLRALRLLLRPASSAALEASSAAATPSRSWSWRPRGRGTNSALWRRAHTEYRDFGESYRYAYVSLQINGSPFVLQPIDCVGEKALGPGKATYAISVVDPDRRILSIRTLEE